MSESKHTPGPWFVNTPRTLPEVIASDGTPICKCHSGSFGNGPANATLIAAAPEMLDDLERKQVQLAGCLMASEGNTELDEQTDAYGWSPAYQSIVALYRDRERMLDALTRLVDRCDGEDGVRADGSNIDTQEAHAAIAKAEGREVEQ